MSTTHNRRSVILRPRSSLAIGRAPLGTPGMDGSQSRDSRQNSQAKVQILSRLSASSKPGDNQEDPATGIEGSISSLLVTGPQESKHPVADTEPQTSESPIPTTKPTLHDRTVLATDASEMAGQRYFRNDSRHYPVNEPPGLLMPHEENHESPRSMVPTSLEDYVVFKPATRRDRKGSKSAATQSHGQVSGREDSHASQTLASPFQENPPSDTQRILDEGYEAFKASMDVIQVKLPDAFPNFSESELDALFDYPIDIHEGNGNLSSTYHRNGDLSVFQWQRTDFCWVYIGRIPKARAGQFARALNNIYDNNQHFNVRWHRQARARIVTMVKQFCDPIASLVLNESANSPVSRRIYIYQRQHGIPVAPSSTQLTRDLQAGTSLFDRNSVPHRELQPKELINRFYTRTDMAEHSYPSIELSGPSTNPATINIAADVRHEYRERERQRLMQNARVGTNNLSLTEHLDQSQLGNASMEKFQPSGLSPKAPPEIDQNKSAEQTINRRPGIEDLRRNLFLEPLRRKSNLVQALNRELGPRPRVKTETMAFPVDTSLGHAKSSTTEPLFPDKTAKPTPVSETQRVERPSLKGPTRSYIPSSLTDDELRASVPLVPQALNGPFLTGKGLNPLTGAATGPAAQYPTDQEYNEALDAFWYSGMKPVQRQKEFINRCLAANNETPQSNPDAATAMRVMVPVYENLQSYTMRGRRGGGLEPRPNDYFAKFVDPPEWCINRSLVGMSGGRGPGNWLSGRATGGGVGVGEGSASAAGSGGGGGGGGSVVAEGVGLGSAIIPNTNRVQSLLGEAEWTSAPERVGRDPRYRPFLGGGGGGGGFGGIGSGRSFR